MRYLLLVFLLCIALVNGLPKTSSNQVIKSDNHLHRGGVELLDRHDVIDRFLGYYHYSQQNITINNNLSLSSNQHSSKIQELI